MRSALLFLCTYFTLSASFRSYKNYKTYEISVTNENDINYLIQFRKQHGLDFWSNLNTVGKPVIVMVAPNYQENFLNGLKERNITFKIQLDDIDSFIEYERTFHNQWKNQRNTNQIDFDHYLRHEEINSYLELLAKTYPDLVTISNVGQSYQNRTMRLIQISTGTLNPPKPVIFVEAGIHAREWIAPAFALYIINQLVEKSEENKNLIENVDWVILPSANPDGYDYTWNEDRLWRKTLSPGAFCDGADANRNFGFHWMEAGADDFECSEIYAGKEAFSEVEARNQRDALASVRNIKAYLSLHSYGQYILYPYSYADVLAENWEELQNLGDRINQAISSVAGTKYTVGASAATLYPAAGCSDDWAKGAANVSVVYVFELPGGGRYGFDLPSSQILPVSVETWEGVKVLHSHIEKNYQ